MILIKNKTKPKVLKQINAGIPKLRGGISSFDLLAHHIQKNRINDSLNIIKANNPKKISIIIFIDDKFSNYKTSSRYINSTSFKDTS